jgi:hypothetical protein
MAKFDTTVAELINLIRTGELRLPEMQRRYVWPATRVRDLLDSLYRNYPSGTILVWETDSEMPTRDLAVGQEISPFAGHKLLLDGQQRLTSLSAVLRGEAVNVRNRKRPIEILFNLEHPDGPPVEVTEVEDDITEMRDLDESDENDEEETLETTNVQEAIRNRTFVVASRTLAADPRWINVSDVLSGAKTDTQVLRPLVKSFDDPLFEKYSNRLQALRRIKDYPYVVHVLDKSLSYEEVAEIFVRVNSLGMKLRGSDLALAQITSRWKDSLKLFERFQEECEDVWFTIDLGLLVRALVVFATGQSRFKTVGTISTNKLVTAWPVAQEAIRYSINFLRANAGIEDESLLSSPLFFISLAYYAQKHNFALTAQEERELRRWLYIANARGHYSRGSTETILDADLKSIERGESVSELFEILMQQLGRLDIQPNDFIGRGRRSALFTMSYLALKARGAKDWRSRLGLSLTHQGRYHFIQFHHLFPKALLKLADVEPAQINEIANMAFIAGGTNRRIAAKPPQDYLAEILETQGREALEAHCVPSDPQLWCVERYQDFLAFRRAELAQAINDLITVDKPLKPTSIENLIALGEGPQLEFKSSMRWDYKTHTTNKSLEMVVAKTVAAFLNTDSGSLLIGVSDDGTILGLEADYRTLGKRPNRDGYQQFLVNLLNQTLGKVACASSNIEFGTISGQEVCCVHVKASPKPVYLQDGGGSKLYVRSASTTQELDAKDAVSYVEGHWNNR